MKLGCNDLGFFSTNISCDWIKYALAAPEVNSPLFLAGLWEVWKFNNKHVFYNTTIPQHTVLANICTLAEVIFASFYGTHHVVR